MEEEKKQKITSITVDTLTAIQSDEWMTNKRKAGHDKWFDYGQSIYQFIMDIQARGFEIILVLGEPGTGKSSGMRTLKPRSNIWYNADDKNPVWIGGRAEYGKKNSPTKLHKIPKRYEDITKHLDIVLKAGGFEEDRYAFLLGHTETFKKGNDTLERLKTIGLVATKMQIEGKMETVLYSRVEVEDGKPQFLLETQNSGFNTARSHQEMFEGKIPNDYGLIIEKLSTF